MEKQIKREQIFHMSKGIPKMTESHQYTWGEVKKMLEEKKIILEDTDTLIIETDGGYEGEDCGSDPCYNVEVWRSRVETDDEFERRKSFLEKRKEESKKERYKEFLKLKKEFGE